MSEIMDVRRANFESWILSSFMSDGDRDLVLRDELGEYYSVGVAERWEMYNAALDSICVDLPEPDAGYSEEGYHGQVTMRIACEEAIERAGLKVKP